MAFGLIESDSKISKFAQVGPDLGNMQIKEKCHWVKFSTPGGNDNSSLCRTQINQNIIYCMNFQVKSAFCLSNLGLYILQYNSNNNRK